MNELDTLKPEVRDAVSEMDKGQTSPTWREDIVRVEPWCGNYAVIRAELLRLAAENANLLKSNKDCIDWYDQMRADYYALRQRIADAPIAIGGEAGLCVAAGWNGVRVRLVVCDE